MIKYPIEFHSSTLAHAGTNQTWATSCSQGQSLCCVPTEFEGGGGALSPEDLFNHALTNCFVATFQVYAQNSKLTFDKLDCNSRLVVDLDENKKPVMKEFHCKVQISNPSNSEKALLLAKKAMSSGFILNSVKTQTHFEFEIL